MGGIVSGNSDDGCDRAEIAGPAAPRDPSVTCGHHPTDQEHTA
jgi:hypothetical protein